MSADRWNVGLDSPGRRYYSAAVVLGGVAIDDHNQSLLLELALSIHKGGRVAELWTDYLVAVGNRLAAQADALAEDAAADDLDDAVADAWDALAPELPSTLRMPLGEARYVAHQIDDMAGRVGVEGGRAA